MWYEFEMNKTFLSNLYNEKRDFTLAGFCGVPLIYCQSGIHYPLWSAWNY